MVSRNDELFLGINCTIRTKHLEGHFKGGKATNIG